MTYKEHLMVVAMEEAAEVQQAISKALRFGGENAYKGRDTNAIEIVKEYHQLCAVMSMLTEEGVLPDIPSVEAIDIRRDKERKVKRNAKRSQAMGYISEPLDGAPPVAKANGTPDTSVLSLKGVIIYRVDMDQQLPSKEIEEFRVDNIVICADGDVLLKYDSYDGVICTLQNLTEGTPYLDYYLVFIEREDAEDAARRKKTY